MTRTGSRQHLAIRGYGANGMRIRCKCGQYEPVPGTAREQEDAHRAHRVAMGETVKPRVPSKLERVTAERDRYRQAWLSARRRANQKAAGK